MTARIDIALHLIEKQFGASLTLEISRDFVVYRRRLPNDPQLYIHMQNREHLHPLEHEVQDYIKANFQYKTTQAEFVEMNDDTVKHLQRGFKHVTGTLYINISIIIVEPTMLNMLATILNLLGEIPVGFMDIISSSLLNRSYHQIYFN